VNHLFRQTRRAVASTMLSTEPITVDAAARRVRIRTWTTSSVKRDEPSRQQSALSSPTCSTAISCIVRKRVMRSTTSCSETGWGPF